VTTKREERDDPESCFNKAADDEETFVLRGQDETMPETIAFWIMQNVSTAPEEKLRRAFETMMAARKQSAKMPD
jgi:hypothetical protein